VSREPDTDVRHQHRPAWVPLLDHIENVSAVHDSQMRCLADLGRQLGQGAASHSLQRLLAREPGANLERRQAEPEALVIGDMDDEPLADHRVEQVVALCE
jgi:hypothetical protein